MRQRYSRARSEMLFWKLPGPKWISIFNLLTISSTAKKFSTYMWGAL
jgi:hypothetical protein